MPGCLAKERVGKHVLVRLWGPGAGGGEGVSYLPMGWLLLPGLGHAGAYVGLGRGS